MADNKNTSQDFNTSRELPLFRKVYFSIKNDILRGIYKQGSFMTSERELAAAFHVSRRTIRQAILLLKRDLLIHSEKNRYRIGKNNIRIDTIKRSKDLSGLIGIITPFPASSEVLVDIMRKTRTIFKKHRLTPVIFDTWSPDIFHLLERERASLQSVLSNNYVGLLIYYLGENWNLFLLNELKQRDTKIVLLYGESPHFPCDSAVLDDEEAGYIITKHFIERGHRRIGMISYPYSLSDTRLRMNGYMRALEESAISIDPNLVFVDRH